MTVWELVVVLWLFCALIGGTAMFMYFYEQDPPKGDTELILIDVLVSAVVGLIMGPFLIGNILGALRNSIETSAEIPEKSDSVTQKS